MSKENPDTRTFPEIEEDNRTISRTLGEVQIYLGSKQKEYAEKEHALRVAMAKSRVALSSVKNPDTGKNYTEQQKEDEALIDNEELSLACAILEAVIDVGKGKMSVLRTQAELVRSEQASARVGYEIERTSRG